MEEPAAATAMEEEEPAAAERRRQLPWRGTVAVQAALCLALYVAFSLGEPQLFPRGGGVDALGRGARGGGVAFLSVADGWRTPAEQAKLLRQVRAVLLPPMIRSPGVLFGLSLFFVVVLLPPCGELALPHCIASFSAALKR